MKNNILKIVFLLIISMSLAYSSYSQSYISNENSNEMSLNYDLTIYPNPVTNNHFFVKSDATITSVEVINVIGQSVMKVNNDTGVAYNIPVSLPDCDKGMYMVKVTYIDNKVSIKKIFVK